MKRTLLLVFALALLGHVDNLQAQAYLTFKVKTSYPSSLTIQAKPSSYTRGENVWSAKIDSSMTVVATLAPRGLMQYIVQDANYIITTWPRLEDGDSLVYFIDLDSATESVIFDKRGYHTIASDANRIFWLHQRRGDSAAAVLPFSAFKAYLTEIEGALLHAIRPTIDSMKGSVYLEHWRGYLADFRYRLLRSYLRREWKESTKQTLSKPLSISAFIPLDSLPDENYARVFGDWLQIMIDENHAKGGKQRIDSLHRNFLSSLSGRQRALAFMQYAQMRLVNNTSDADMRGLDSLATLLIPESEIKLEYQAMIEERQSLRVGRLAPELALPDGGGVIRKLSDLRGHVVLLDFWGTWCAPCLGEQPALDSLARHFDGTNLRILSVALEYKNVATWKRKIEQKKLPGMHLYAEAQFQNEQVKNFGVDRSGVPAYFLLDPEGTIIMTNSLRPSNPKLWRMIEAALAKPH